MLNTTAETDRAVSLLTDGDDTGATAAGSSLGRELSVGSTERTEPSLESSCRFGSTSPAGPVSGEVALVASDTVAGGTASVRLGVFPGVVAVLALLTETRVAAGLLSVVAMAGGGVMCTVAMLALVSVAVSGVVVLAAVSAVSVAVVLAAVPAVSVGVVGSVLVASVEEEAVVELVLPVVVAVLSGAVVVGLVLTRVPPGSGWVSLRSSGVVVLDERLSQRSSPPIPAPSATSKRPIQALPVGFMATPTYLLFPETLGPNVG